MRFFFRWMVFTVAHFFSSIAAEEWDRKRRYEEELMMKDKPKTYDYTVPYQAHDPPRDINKYFHDSKYMDEPPEPKDDDYYFEARRPDSDRRGMGLSTYCTAFVPPGFTKLTQQQPGGLYIIRFHNSGADEVNVSLKEQQSIIKSFNGHVLGIATKDQVLVLEGDADWRFARSQGNQDRRRAVMDGIAVLWFPNRSKAFDFFSNSFRNRFKQQGFPTPHGWEGHFIPMKMPIMYKSLNTYLILEVLNAAKYSKDQLEFFEMKTREAIMNAYPNSMPLVSAAFRDREAFRPGPLFKDRSVVYISRFSSMNNACEAWESGTISRWLTEAGITGPINVSVFGLSEWVDY